MRNILPLATLAIFVLIGVGLIVGGVVMLGYGAKALFEGRTKATIVAEATPPPLAEAIERPVKPVAQSLLSARQNFQTAPARSSYQASHVAPEPVAQASIIKYPSGENRFYAYLSRDRDKGVKQPAVVWAHGGFGGLDREDWVMAQAFHDAGAVLMVPSFRGENDNAGRFEMFYGEVNDLLAAVEYVSKLPYVDPNRIFVAGHGSGGTLALLAAVTGTTRVRAFFSIAGMPNLEEYLDLTKGFGFDEATPPFDPNRRQESELRSAVRFVGAIRQPTFYFGTRSEGVLSTQAEEMERRAAAQSAPFQKYIFRNPDKLTIVEPVVHLLSAKIVKDDSGPMSTIEFTSDELRRLFVKSKK